MQCPNCGNPDVTGRFCTKCGTLAPAPPAAGPEYDASFNPYESVARQREDVRQQHAPPPAPEEPQQPQAPSPQPQAPPPPTQIKKQSGYKPSLGENIRSFIADPATYFQYNAPRDQVAAALFLYVLVTLVQGTANMLLFGMSQLASRQDPDRFLYRAVLAAAYPPAAALVASLLLAAYKRGLPDIRAVFILYALCSFPYFLAAAPLPFAIVFCLALSTLHLRAGFNQAFEDLPSAWLWTLSLGVPAALWIAAATALGFSNVL